jgi:hypothetical protein
MRPIRWDFFFFFFSSTLEQKTTNNIATKIIKKMSKYKQIKRKNPILIASYPLLWRETSLIGERKYCQQSWL